MFAVPKIDRRLKNKDEVLVIRAEGDGHLAIATEFLESRPVYQGAIEGKAFVVLTDETGANRVYETGTVRFLKWKDPQTVIAENGIEWRVTEDALVLDGVDGYPTSFGRLSAHRAFWFGWNAAFPNGKLIKSRE